MQKQKQEKDCVEEMLKENTGKHFLDSGSAYGRHWERNQGKDFEQQEPFWIEVSKHSFITYISVYHYIKSMCYFSEDLQKEFENNLLGDKESWLSEMEHFATEVKEGKGLYGEGLPMTVNTYNGESSLTQTMQFVYWEDDNSYDEDYAAIQIHNGCDVRGGYTKPKMFRVYDGVYFLMNYNKFELICNMNSREHCWLSESGGYSWDSKVVGGKGDKIDSPSIITKENFINSYQDIYSVDIDKFVGDPESNELYCPECLKKIMKNGDQVCDIPWEEIKMNPFAQLEF